MNVTISKALKIKNRVIREISSLEDKITKHNQVMYIPDTQKPKYELDTKFLHGELFEKRNLLAIIKTSIHNASEPVRIKIFQLSELKSHIKFVDVIPAENGTVTKKYSDVLKNVKSQINVQDIDNFKKELQEKIDNIQDELDEFNAITKVEIPEL